MVQVSEFHLHTRAHLQRFLAYEECIRFPSLAVVGDPFYRLFAASVWIEYASEVSPFALLDGLYSFSSSVKGDGSSPLFRMMNADLLHTQRDNRRK